MRRNSPMRRLLIIAAIIATIAPILAHAADVTRTLERKKFKLHSLGISFRTRPTRPTKLIARPIDQSIGMMVQQELDPQGQPYPPVELFAEFSPPLMLATDRYTWSGAATGQGAGVSVAYASEGNRTVNLAVHDERGTDKTSFANIRVRFVPSQTEAYICSADSPLTFVLCPYAFSDASRAVTWAHSTQTANDLGWPSGGLDNGRTNAAQHTYWNVLMTRDLGAATARVFADAHERGPAIGFGLNQGTPHNGSVMDLDNNASGRQIGTNRTFTTSSGDDDPGGQAAVISAGNAGALTVMDDATPTSNGNADAQGLLQPSNQ